ncbi:ATP-binding cassette domain-containing protein [Paracoccus sp. S-4012]|uniref:ABC transporter ATP-binding protein n=1 Tax=Paracoccus sp. S-4012 TaxID=2665648 RepID=UPI0012AF825D|nr:ABC transporter ATP-binding protein [Paracoccus sp. S-4012]MRX51746.1 ATP-binding cassette domain-containing protein [Paracoccus sp. S-4012]
MSFLTLENLKKSFGQTQVVHDFSLAVGKGEFVSLLGPSGCGKTTVLRMIAGFETTSAGRIRIDGQDVTALPPARRQIGMVFQAYALFPNLTAAGNVGFGLRVAGVPRRERAARVAEMLALIGLPDLGDRYPFQLSGGQQQRVALARALAPRPRVLLLDEPLSALDAKIRVSLRAEIRELQRTLGITTIFVTHDQEEALSMSDRVVVMHQGRAAQVGTPAEIYDSPANAFVAGFVGQLNRLPARVVDAGTGRVELAGHPLTLAATLPASGQVTLAARPEAFRPAPAGLPVEVETVEFLGALRRVHARLPDGSALVFDMFNSPDAPAPRMGERLTLAVDPSAWIVEAA